MPPSSSLDHKTKKLAQLPPRRVHGIRETAHLLGVSERKIYQLVETGALATFVIAGRRVTTPEEIDRFIEAARAKGTQLGAPKGACATNAARARHAKLGALA